MYDQQVLYGTVTAGGSISSAFDLQGRVAVAIEAPGTVAGTTLAFRHGSGINNGTLTGALPVHDSAGNLLSVVSAASRVITDIPELAPLRYVAVVMGGGTQSTDAIFKLWAK